MSNLKKATSTSYNKQLDWLKANAQYLSINAIEAIIGCPNSTIQKFVQGSRDIPEKWIEPIATWILNFKK